MRLVKYLVAALLVISITKKVHVAPTDTTPDQNIKYDTSTKTALLKTTCEEMYVGVIEYNRSVTPPNIMIPALKLFATIPTPNYQPSSHDKPILGGLNPTTSLYGIPVTGLKYHVKSDEKIRGSHMPVMTNKPSKKRPLLPYETTIGLYWPTNKIVQLQSGQVFVGVQEETKGNYINLFGQGPIWTRLDESAKKDLLNLYNVSVTNESFKKIGTFRKDRQTINLYGILLNTHPSLK